MDLSTLVRCMKEAGHQVSECWVDAATGRFWLNVDGRDWEANDLLRRRRRQDTAIIRGPCSTGARPFFFSPIQFDQPP